MENKLFTVMENQVYSIETDEYLRSKLKYGTREFPFAYYYDEINRYLNHAVEWHWHTGMELSFVIAGPIHCYVGSKEILLQSGDALFINRGVIHRFTSDSGGVTVNFIFESDFLAPIGSVIHTSYVLPVMASDLMYTKIDSSNADSRNILEDLISAQNEIEIQGNAWEIRVTSLILDAWSVLCRILITDNSLNGVYSKKDSRTYARMRKMLNFIHDHYDEDIGLEHISNSVSVSKSEALRCFRSLLGTTPILYLTQYRLSRAQEMLLKGDDSVLQIALKCGFDNSSYFSKVFKKHVGMSPMEYSRRYAENTSAQ